MARPKGDFRMEASGSLTPELTGSARSKPHQRTVHSRQSKNQAKDDATHERH